MAEIGKVVVSIEARIGALEAGLAQAELSIKKSGERMAAAQDTLAKKFERSWVEISSKVSLYSQALDLVGKTMTTLGSIGPAFDDSLSPEKSLEAIEELQRNLESLPLGLGAIASGLKSIINLTTGWGDEFDRIVEAGERLELSFATAQQNTAFRTVMNERLRFLELELKLVGDRNNLEKVGDIRKAEADERRRDEIAKVNAVSNKIRSSNVPEPFEPEYTGFGSHVYLKDRMAAMERNIVGEREYQRAVKDGRANAQREIDRLMAKVEEVYQKEMDLINAQVQEGTILQEQADERVKSLEEETEQRREQLKMDREAAESEGRRLNFQKELERLNKKESDARRDSLKDQKSELEKLIALEEERLAGRPDVSTGSIQTALGSFTIAMPEGQRIQKAQLEKLEDLRELLRNIERQMRKMNDRSMGDFPVIPAA